MHNVKAGKPKIGLFALVRDKNGKPKFDKTDNIHPELWKLLTDEEKEEIKDGRNPPRNSS